MGKKQTTERRKAVLKRETLRKLDAATLGASDLDKVAGGVACTPRQTCRCSAAPD